MSSTETLTFGPEWLRNLSGGSTSTSSPGSASSVSTIKFKLAQYRYGREEMLALFEKQDEIHPELAEAPNLISTEALTPISLIPLTEEDQRAFSGGVNSETYRGRGGPSSFRGRSAPPRGRGRGRGDGYSRSMSQTDDGSGSSYSRGSSRDYSRRESWDERGFRGRSFDDGPSRKPLRRSDVSADWRSDANQAGGDGTDGDDSRPEWRPPAPSRRDGWRDGGRTSNWRESGGREWNDASTRRPLNRTRSLSNKYDHGDSALMPEWAEDTDNMEVGMFNSSGAFEIQKKSNSSGKNDLNNKSNQRSTAQLKRIDERDKSVGEEEAAQAKLRREKVEASKLSPDQESPGTNEEEDVFEESGAGVEPIPEESKPPPVSPPKESPPPVEPPMPIPKEPEIAKPAAEIKLAETKPAESPPVATEQPPAVAPLPTTQADEEPQMHHLEEAALKLVDSISEADDQLPWGAQPAGGDILGNVNPAIPDLATKWFYKDPQGETQGPFGAMEMKEWFIAGYFTVNLLVKRACDPQFIALGDLIAKWGGMPFDKKHGLSPQPSTADLQLLALQQQQQQQKQFQLQQQQQQQLLQQQLLRQQQQQQQQQHMRALQQQQALLVQQLSKSEEFLAMPVPQQQAVLAQYMQQLQQQQPQVPAATTASINVASASSPLHSLWESDPSIVSRHSPVTTTTAQQHQLIEMLKQKAQEQDQLAKKKQEEQEAQRRREEEQRKLEEEQRRREQEELLRKHEEALRLQAEEAKRKEEEARRLQADRLREKMLQEQERIKREEERKEELRRLEEEKERKRLEEARKRQEEEERRKEAVKRQAEEEEKRRMEESIRKKMEEEKEKQRKKELERLQQQQKLEEERALQEKKAQEEAAKKLEIQRMKDEALRKRQQEQLKDMKLPASANWAHQPSSSQQSALSVASIQKQEAAEERKKEQEQLRQMKQQQKVQAPTQVKGVWGAGGVPGMSAPAPSAISRALSLKEIQIEEERKLNEQKQSQPKPDLSFPTALAWSGRQPQQGSAPAAWGVTSPVQHTTTVPLWDFAKPKEKPSHEPPKQQAKSSRGKQKTGGSTAAESSNVVSLFKQGAAGTPSDLFATWCEDQLQRLQAAKNIDISTFIAFLRDIESPYDVKDYVTSYLGESRATRDFAESFIQRRNVHLKQQRQQKAKKVDPEVRKVPTQPQSAVTGWNQVATDRSQLEVVTGSTKRGKKKQKKLQKVDPSILGFSVNASSDRFNMGEIKGPEDT